MARVSLIVLRSPGISWPSDRVAAYRAGLQELGYTVEVLAVSDPTADRPFVVDEPWCETIVAGAPGLAESAISGLRTARGHLLVVVDLAMPYTPENLFAVVERLALGDAHLVVASRPMPWTGRLALQVLGTTDPTSGLVGLTRTGAIEADDSFAPVGSRFTLELLARVAGRRVDEAGRAGKGRPPDDHPFRRPPPAQATGRRPVRQRLSTDPVLLRGRVGDGRRPDLLRPLAGDLLEDRAGRHGSARRGRVACPGRGGGLRDRDRADLELLDQPSADLQRRTPRVNRPAVSPLRPEQPAGDRREPDPPPLAPQHLRLLPEAPAGGGRGGHRGGDRDQLLDGPLVRLRTSTGADLRPTRPHA